MKNLKLIAGVILFGSLWGFSEVIIGSGINETGIPTGAIMTGFFALFFLVFSRISFKKPGMQLGMGLVAGSLKLFNPFVGCHLCSAIAIMAEGAIFELIWYKFALDDYNLSSIKMKSSIGIITAYLTYISGYIITQVLTPIVSGANFYIENLIVFIPNILGGGLIAAVIGGITVPIALLIYKFDFSIKDTLYYPTSIGISILCWILVIGNWLIA
jgi:hypothetical protein